MIEEDAEDERSSLPATRWPATPDDLVGWAESLQESVRHEPVEPVSLLRLLARARTTAKTATAVEEWLLMLAREQGATLEDLAEVTGASRKYVRGPDKRLNRLAEQYGAAETRLAALAARVRGEHATDPET